MIAFVSSIIADIQGDYPNYSWWSLAFMLMCIVAVFVTVATDSVHTPITWHWLDCYLLAWSSPLHQSTHSSTTLTLQKKLQQQALFCCPWYRYVVINSPLTDIHQLTRLFPDRMDLLLRLATDSNSPSHSRLFRTAQGGRTFSQQPIHVAKPPPTRHTPL